MVSKTYTGVVTPAVTYAYNAGWLTSVTTAAVTSPAIAATAWQNLAFDGLGRVTRSSQTTNGVTYTFPQYQYNLADGMSQMTLPSGRNVMNGYDGGGRLCSVSGMPSGAAIPAPPYPCTVTATATLTAYANNAQHYPHGAIQTIARGDGLSENWGYNDRLEATSVTVGPVASPVFGLSLYYCPSKAMTCAANNGNVVTVTPASTGVDQLYGYTDGVNRLNSMQEGTNTQSWQYDNRGNRWVSGGSGLPQSSFMPSSSSGYNASNQLTLGGAQYTDERGNQTAIGSYVYTYDAENRLATSTLNGAATTYSYDGEGRRVLKQNAGGTTAFVYDAFGNLAGEYGEAGASLVCTTCYVSVDPLGSTRMVTNAAGTVIERHDYMPFGDELFAGVGGRTTAQGYPTSTGSGTTSVLFTGQYRDAEDVSSAMPGGLDYFGARYMASAQGRFTSVDPDINLGLHLSDPQGWNGYAYGRNNPLKYTDPTGENYTVCGVNGKDCSDLTDDQYNQFLSSQGVKNISGNQLTFIGQDGSRTAIGTADYYDEKVFSRNGANQIVGDAGPAVNAAYQGLRVFGYLVAAPAMAIADYGAGNGSATGIAMAVLPEVSVLYEGGQVLKTAAALGKKGAEIVQKTGGLSQALKDFEALGGSEAIQGTTRVRTLSDGTKAVLYTSSSGAEPTIQIQHAAGGVSKFRY